MIIQNLIHKVLPNRQNYNKKQNNQKPCHFEQINFSTDLNFLKSYFITYPNNNISVLIMFWYCDCIE